MAKKTVTQARSDRNPAKGAGDEQTALSKMYEDTLRDIAEGSIVSGRVIEVRPNEVLVDIGYKSEGVLPSSEFRGDTSQVQPGDQFEVLIENLEDDDGMVVLSKTRAEQQRKWENVVNNCTEGSTIPGEVRGRVKGGLIIDIGVEAFLPGSQVDIAPVRNP
ncbi:MAG: S1 RNA-binding domain-containing protein, partial [Verrucomicrobia bacterium]|nr:S1 RNA-binding domain-containing protein [Verrucomicrobiota bacterium]